jgi:hypothetical protein
MVVLDVEGGSFSMKSGKSRFIGVVDEHKSVCLYPVNAWPKEKPD